jgi:hypothetical protein
VCERERERESVCVCLCVCERECVCYMLYTTPQYTPIHPLTLSHTPSHSSTPFGLSSNIFSTDYTKAERVGTQVKAGMLTINDFAMVPMVGSLPFGGVGDR